MNAYPIRLPDSLPRLMSSIRPLDSYGDRDRDRRTKKVVADLTPLSVVDAHDPSDDMEMGL